MTKDALTWFHRTEAVDGEAAHRCRRARRCAREVPRRSDLARRARRPLTSAYDVAVLDLDGVVYVGQDAVDGAAGGAERRPVRGDAPRLRDQQRRAPALRRWATHLRELGIDAHDEDVVTSAQAAARLLAGQLPEGSKVFLMGGEGLDLALRERGLVPVTEPYRRRGRGGPGLRPGHAAGSRSCRVRSWSARGCPWVASNTDMTIPTPSGVGPGQRSRWCGWWRSSPNASRRWPASR